MQMIATINANCSCIGWCIPSIRPATRSCIKQAPNVQRKCGLTEIVSETHLPTGHNAVRTELSLPSKKSVIPRRSVLAPKEYPVRGPLINRNSCPELKDHDPQDQLAACGAVPDANV